MSQASSDTPGSGINRLNWVAFRFRTYLNWNAGVTFTRKNLNLDLRSLAGELKRIGGYTKKNEPYSDSDGGTFCASELNEKLLNAISTTQWRSPCNWRGARKRRTCQDGLAEASNWQPRFEVFEDRMPVAVTQHHPFARTRAVLQSR